MQSLDVEYVKTLGYKLFFLYGPMGAGKTTFVQKFFPELNIKSPTFPIVYNYELNGKNIYHFDLYRLDHCDVSQGSRSELSGERYNTDNIGFLDAIINGDYIFVEWPQILETLTLPIEPLKLEFTHNSINIKL